MTKSNRRIVAVAILGTLGALLIGCGSGDGPPGVRLLSPDDGASLESKRVAFRAEPDVPEGTPVGPLTLRWSFGDGTTDVGAEVTHTYDRPGDYTVSVVAVTERGRTGEPTERSITVRNAPPTAQITATPTEGSAPLDVRLNADGSSDPDGAIQTFRWDLGDGTVQTGERVAHTYSSSGEFEATLTVRDVDGAEASATTTITASRSSTRPSDLTWDVRMVTAADGRTSFDPAVLVVEPGDTVRWTVSTGRHSSTSYDAGLPPGAEPWDTGILDEPGEYVEIEIPEDAPSGSYPYHCRVHEGAGMLGLIVIGEPSELDPDFRQGLPRLLREELNALIDHAEERTGGGPS